MKPSLNSISWPSTVIDRKVVFLPGCGSNGRSAASADRNQLTSARSQLHPAGHSLVLPQVHFRDLSVAEQPDQQIEEVDADVGDDAARSILAAFPRHVVPAAARGDVGEADLAGPRQPFGVESRFAARSGRDAGAAAARCRRACRFPARAPASASRFHGLITSGFSQIASAPERSARRMCASCR